MQKNAIRDVDEIVKKCKTISCDVDKGFYVYEKENGMHIEMLKAVSEMLELKDSSKVDIALAQVKCAKIMLDGIIKGMAPVASTSTVGQRR